MAWQMLIKEIPVVALESLQIYCGTGSNNIYFFLFFIIAEVIQNQDVILRGGVVSKNNSGVLKFHYPAHCPLKWTTTSFG